MNRPDDWSRLRVGDAERDQAARALGEHYALGRLSDVEHGERLDACWSARTRADLDVLFHDLPTAVPAPGEPGYQPTPSSGPPGIPTPWLIALAVVGLFAVAGRAPGIVVLLIVAAFVIVKVRRHQGRRQHRHHDGDRHRGHGPPSGPWR